MIRVLVLGQPYWGTRIARALDTRGGDLTAEFVAERSYATLLGRRLREEHVVLMRAGYRVGAATRRGRLFDAYWSMLRRRFPRATACHYWLGSDVMDTLRDVSNGSVRVSALDAARLDAHIADAPWLTDELATVGLKAITAPVPQPYRAPVEPPPLPADFGVLSYLADRRLDFYGGDSIMEAASRLPDVRFDIVGASQPALDADLPNVAWHGWVSDMPARYARATVVVRIPHHDGLGATVIEGLLNARHVIYVYEMPFVRLIRPITADRLTQMLSELLASHRDGSLALNLPGRAYAKEAFDEDGLADRLAGLVRSWT